MAQESEKQRMRVASIVLDISATGTKSLYIRFYYLWHESNLHRKTYTVRTVLFCLPLARRIQRALSGGFEPYWPIYDLFKVCLTTLIQVSWISLTTRHELPARRHSGTFFITRGQKAGILRFKLLPSDTSKAPGDPKDDAQIMMRIC